VSDANRLVPLTTKARNIALKTLRFSAPIIWLITIASCTPTFVSPKSTTSNVVSVRLERMGGFGSGSPGTYNLVFFGDGTAAYIGLFAVKQIGVFVGRVPFPAIAALIGSHDIERYGRKLAPDTFDGEYVRLTITRTNGQVASMTTLNADTLPRELKSLVAGLDTIGRRVSWRVAATLGPPMGTYIYADDDLALSLLEVYPGGSPLRAEAFIENYGHNPCNPPGLTQSSGTVVWRQVAAAPKSFAAENVPKSIDLTVEGRKLRASGALNHLYSPTSARDARARIKRFVDETLGGIAKVSCHQTSR
jgi:hypothetical protein